MSRVQISSSTSITLIRKFPHYQNSRQTTAQNLIKFNTLVKHADIRISLNLEKLQKKIKKSIRPRFYHLITLKMAFLRLKVGLKL